MIRVETDGFGDLTREMRKASARVGKEVMPVVRKGAQNVRGKNTGGGMRGDMRKSRHFGQVARTIGYDVERTPVAVEATIGAATGGRVVGDLAHIAYFGGINGGGNTVRDPEFHANEEAPRFEKAIADVVDGLL